MAKSIKTRATLLKPFRLATFDEVLPAGDYLIKMELIDPVDWIDPGDWIASVLVHLKSCASRSGRSRTLTVPLIELERAEAEDKVTGKALFDYFLQEMLADPMICLVMQADGVAEDKFRASRRGMVTAKPAREIGGFVALPMQEKPEASNPLLPKPRDQVPTKGDAVHDANERPTDLDRHRSPESRIVIGLRRKAANAQPASDGKQLEERLEAALLAGPAQSWGEAMTRAKFLLERFAATAEADDARIRTLIDRLLGDMDGLNERGE
ncbi:hypothetical protein [Histidinibacterium aquaticum]|uniref:hypothetical protein n=1 Tax=Histidinibacterium aquaticum TaxID=2613962 RepID=UPI00168B9054|nr:hypothetical protein [Histidinibacterium aquaticum]